MTSTCINCNKQFEWDHFSYRLARVKCCHCGFIEAYSVAPIVPLESRPLQVAKKWVVQITKPLEPNCEWLANGCLQSGYYNAFKFGSLKDATNALLTWVSNYGKSGVAYSIHEELT